MTGNCSPSSFFFPFRGVPKPLLLCRCEACPYNRTRAAFAKLTVDSGKKQTNAHAQPRVRGQSTGLLGARVKGWRFALTFCYLTFLKAQSVACFPFALLCPALPRFAHFTPLRRLCSRRCCSRSSLRPNSLTTTGLLPDRHVTPLPDTRLSLVHSHKVALPTTYRLIFGPKRRARGRPPSRRYSDSLVCDTNARSTNEKL